MFLKVLTGLLIVTILCDSARILVVSPTPSISHQVTFRAITLELAKRGHEVVVITTDPIFTKDKAPVNYTEINVHDISYDIWEKFVHLSTREANLYEQAKFGIKLNGNIVEQQLKTDELQQLLNNKEQKFDLLFIESWVTLSLAFTHIFKVPTIQISTLGPIPRMFETVGAPSHTFLYPLPFRRRIQNMSVWEKISEIYNSYLINKLYYDIEPSENQKLKEMFGPDFPTISELKQNVDMIFLNVHPMWDSNRPVPPNVIYLGGLHQKPQKMLPQDLKSYLDSSSNGVIYMSLGTNVKPSILPRETIQIFLKVFADLPYNVLWKWDQDELEGRPNNVNISKWFPQSDLLQHPNIKLFITQGGLQSTDEAINAGVPLVGIPILGDQWFNTEMYVHHKIGVKLDIETLTKEDFTNAINTVVKDNSYRTNIARLGTLMKDQPQTSMERAIWWTEYVLRHGGTSHLRSPAAHITWAEYFELELLAIVLAPAIFSVIVLFFVTKLSLRFIFQRSKLKSA